MNRTRRFRKLRAALTADSLDLALSALGATVDPDGRWHTPAGTSTPDHYRIIVTTGAGRELSRREMIEILLAAGYQPSSADGRLSTSHPLFQQIGPNRYRIVS